MQTRTEHDAYGSVSLGADVHYGIQTVRTVENMSFSGVTLAQFPEYIRALGQVKKACAAANRIAGVLNQEQVQNIYDACNQLIAGQHTDQFPVDVFHGGGGIGINMNVNEVIAHLAGEGVDVNDVNASQSTSDVCHTSLHVHPFRDFPLIAQLYLDGQFKLDELILSRITLAEINRAFEAFHDTTAVNVGRTVVEFGGI